MTPMVTDWLMLGVTAIYVIATIFICIFNGKAAKAARVQTEEMRQQFFAIHRPVINVQLVSLKKGVFWALRFTNVGVITAFDVRFELNDEFINGLPEPEFRDILVREKYRFRTIGVGQYYDLILGTNGDKEISEKIAAEVRIIYKGNDGAIYAEDFDIDIQNYAATYYVDNDLDDIKKLVDRQNKEIQYVCAEIKAINETFKSKK